MTFSFTLNTTATVTLAFTHTATGRVVKHKCVAATKHNKHDRSCKRTVSDGTITLAGHAGTDKVSFDGQLSKHKKLALGSYTLTLTAANSSGRSRSRSTRFTIVKN